jgi:quercetin dioxygenase-like cupin family protein
MSVKNINDIQPNNVPAGTATTIQVLISAQEGPHFAMRRFVIQPGGGMPLHTNTLEHEQYVLAGQARVQIGQEVHFVKQGDVVFIAEGVSHSYFNNGKGDFVFLCLIPNQPDEIMVLDTEC